MTDAQNAQSQPGTTVATPTATSEKHKAPGQSWKENEQHVLPHNRLGIVFFGLMSCTFLAALDQVSQLIAPSRI